MIYTCSQNAVLFQIFQGQNMIKKKPEIEVHGFARWLPSIFIFLFLVFSGLHWGFSFQASFSHSLCFATCCYLLRGLGIASHWDSKVKFICLNSNIEYGQNHTYLRQGIFWAGNYQHIRLPQIPLLSWNRVDLASVTLSKVKLYL